MDTGILTLRKRWPAVAAIAVLLAVALTAGTLFAANERQQQQPELPTVSQQSAMDVTDPVRAVEPPPAPERVSTQPDDDKEAIGLPPIVKVPPKYPNLDSNLNRLVEEASTVASRDAGQQPNTTDNTGGGPASAGEPLLVTFYIDPEQLATVQEFLEDNDVFIRNAGDDYIEAHVLPALLPAASELPGVRRVDTVIPAQPDQSSGSVVSQGVELHQANAWHDMGYRGRGVKVGIIDSGFEGFRQRWGSELPRNVTARCYFEEARAPSSHLADCEVGSDHGTAVAETLIDVAPEVQLYIANPKSRGDLKTAVDWMVENGVDVINRSLSSTYEGPGDGTSPFSNSQLSSIDAAVAGGIVFVNSAGNSARRTWYGRFSDPDGNGFHNFASRNVAANYFYLRYSSEDKPDVRAFIRWDDEWGGADCDLDLYLARLDVSRNTYVTAVSDTGTQNGENNDIPFAWVSFQVSSVNEEGRYALFIKKENCANVPAWMQLTAWDISEFRYYSPGHHIGSLAESRNAGMLAVGATHWWDTEYIADYSSRGPTIDGRVKPDITGVACGRTTQERSTPGSACWFGGTSQAAPHVAGLVALVRQRFPEYAPAQVADYLKQNATERGTSGADNLWGQGFATLPTAALTPTAKIAVRAGSNSGEVVISWDAVPQATHYRIGYVNMEVDYHLVTEGSCTMEPDDWIQAFVYVDVKAPNIPVRDGRAEYTIRRLSPGARHAFTVLTSNNFVDSGDGGSVRSEFFWPSKPRWRIPPGRDTLPPGVTIPPLDCPQ